MSAMSISVVIFACVFGGAMLGVYLRGALPQSHLSADSKETVKLGMGLVATMAALVLGLLVSSAKSFYDTQSTQLIEMASQAIVLDRVLSHYGPETKQVRDLLRASVIDNLDRIWPQERAQASELKPPTTRAEALYDQIQALAPKDDRQRSIQGQALNIVMGLGQTRWLMYTQTTTSVSTPLLIILVFWLTMIFVSFGLYAPPNTTVTATLFVAALSVSGAVFLILEMYTPYSGLIAISSAPLRSTLMFLGQ